MEPPEIVDDVVVATGHGMDRDDLIGVLRRAFDRGAELAAQRNLTAPIALELTDAEGRCLLTMTVLLDETGWAGQTGPGDIETREGLTFPWFLVLQDASGKTVRIRVELDSSPRNI